MRITWQGQTYTFDQGGMRMSQAKIIKQYTGAGLVTWEKQLQEADPDALVALVWVALDQNNVKTDINTLDFTMDELAGIVIEDTAGTADPTQAGVTGPAPA